MTRNMAKMRILGAGLMLCSLCSCFHPPFNDFNAGNHPSYYSDPEITGAIDKAARSNSGSKAKIIRQLKKQDIAFIEYGDTMTLIVPTDKYFIFNSPRLKEICYPGLNNIVRLLKHYPDGLIYVAGFTDNVGSRYQKNMMSQAQAETILSFLWANGVHATRLKAEGYGDKNPVSDNALIHGSAQNRRIEIQWIKGAVTREQTPVMFTK